MKYFYIIDTKGKVYGSFDTAEKATVFGDSLGCAYRLTDYLV
jgi:hypothetical protein